jgi:D-3-phosphoglycerate dehydrogenase
MGGRWRVVASGPWDDPGWQGPLEQAACEVVLGRSVEQFPGQAYDEAQLIDLFKGADAVLVSTRERVSRHVLEASGHLKIVAKATIGVERIDLDAATDLGILVVNSPAPENYLGVAEATIGLIVALTKRMIPNQRQLREGRWKHPDGLGAMLRARTIGIVGLGRVGSNVARRLTGWDVRLLAADPYVEPAAAHAVGAGLVPLDVLVRESDVVTLHVVQTRETTHLINAARLRAMKPTAYLVNTSRGGVVDTAALVRAIREAWIAGAALDVFEEEPLPRNSQLRRLDPDRLILTPHCIGNNRDSHRTGTRMAVDNILRALRGDVPDYVRNPAAIPRWRARFFAGVGS